VYDNVLSLARSAFLFVDYKSHSSEAAGPALASAGPDWKHFCGAPLNGLCRNVLRGHQVIIIEIMSYGEEVRSENGNAKLEVSRA